MNLKVNLKKTVLPAVIGLTALSSTVMAKNVNIPNSNTNIEAVNEEKNDMNKQDFVMGFLSALGVVGLSTVVYKAMSNKDTIPNVGRGPQTKPPVRNA